MSNSQSQPSITITPPPPPPSSYWCYHCDKRVSVETLADDSSDVICTECKFGFVESIPLHLLSDIPSPPPPLLPTADVTTSDNDVIDDSSLGSQFLQVLRLLAHAARDDHAPTTPPPLTTTALPSDPDHDHRDDFLRIEIDGWDQDQDRNRDDHDDEEDEEEVRSVEIEGESEDENENENENESEEEMRRRRREVLRLHLRDMANRTRPQTEGRNRILDWAEILMGLEDNSIEFRFDMPDRYIGNPGDYVDGAEYEALLQNLAEAEGKRGAPPAAKSAVESLKTVEMKWESYVCAVCKEVVEVGEKVKEMPCGHCYHGDCIVPWLGSRNSCPICRFELPTDDPDYEIERKKQESGVGSSTGGGGDDGGSGTTLV